MLYKVPTSKKDKANGFVESYKFKEISSIDLSIETIVGGWDNIDVSKEDRAIYILKGLGYAKIAGKTIRLEEDFVLEIPAGQEVEMSGQLKYICVKSRG
jgi:hypothetical protein